MGCLVDTGFLNEDLTLTEEAKAAFIRDVKEAIINGTSKDSFPCGDPIPPMDPPPDLKLEDEKLYESFHRDIIKGRLEATAKKLDLDPSFALLPAVADPIALAGSFGVNMKPISFPDGFIPYFTGLLPIKFFVDLLNAGVTDFALPANLLPELTKLVTVPTPPNVVPDIPIPPPPLPPDLVSTIPEPPEGIIPGIEAPSANLLTFGEMFPDVDQEVAIPALPPLGAPGVLPVNELQTVIDREIAVVQKIPTLLMELISEVPKLLSKILIPTEILPYICKKIADSGIFPLENPSNSMERVQNAVLSKWFSYFLYIAMISKTLGSSKGSAAASIAKSSPINLFPPEPPEPTRDPRALTPGEKVSAAAESVRGLSFGEKNALYVETLLYVEDLYSKTQKGAFNYKGVPVDSKDPATKPPPGTTRDALASPARHAEAATYGVTYPMGFREYAGWVALDASSCGLFARYCYFKAGANNLFFLSMYPTSSAITGMFIIGAFRNYKWLIPDPNNNNKLTLNSELVSLSKDISDKLAAKTTTLDIATELSKWYYKVDEDGNLKCNGYDKLTPYLKNREDLALITIFELEKNARDGKNKITINPGDAIFLLTVDDAGNEQWDSEHVVIYTSRRKLEITFPSYEAAARRLNATISGIHGGQPDDFNKGDPAVEGESKPKLSEIKNVGKVPGGLVIREKLLSILGIKKNDNEPIQTKVWDDTDSPQRYVNITVKPVGEALYGDGTNYFLSDAEGSRKPTAILQGNYDLGYIRSTGAGRQPGYYLGRTKLPVAGAGVLTSDGPDKPVIPFKKIYAIIRADKYLDPIENGNSEDGSEVAAASEAMRIMDEHPLMQRLLKNLESSSRVKGLIQNVFKYINS